MYCELHCHSHYSLLDGASAPEELLDRAAELGMPALAITDQDGLYGVVPFWRAARKRGIHPVIGAEIALAHGTHLVLLAETQAGYANLSRLLAAGHLAGSKGVPLLKIEDVAQHAGGLLCLAGGREGAVGRALLSGQEELARRTAAKLVEIFGRERVWLELQRHWLPLDGRLEAGIVAVAERLELGLVVTNDVHYATQDRHRLYDILCATRHNVPLAELGARRRPNNEFYLKGEKEMAALFPDRPEALELTRELAERCQVSLDFAHSPDGSAAANRLPAFPTRSDDFPHGIPPGETAFSTLYTLSQSALRSKYQPVTPQAVKQLGHELSVIQAAGLADYFLIVWDIVRFSRCEGIRCQGRGSAANSLVAYLLDITPVDPLRYNLLFERFLSDRTDTMPDIDIDFAADRRDEVMAYVYRLYGADHAAMVCNVVTYQWRSAVRDVARALGYPPESVDRIAKQLKHGPDAGGDTGTGGRGDKGTRGQGDGEAVGHAVGQACSLTPVVGGAGAVGGGADAGTGAGATATAPAPPTGSANASPASTHVHGHHFRGYGGKSVRHVDFLADDSESHRDLSHIPVVQPPCEAVGRGADGLSEPRRDQHAVPARHTCPGAAGAVPWGGRCAHEGLASELSEEGLPPGSGEGEHPEPGSGADGLPQTAPRRNAALAPAPPPEARVVLEHGAGDPPPTVSARTPPPIPRSALQELQSLALTLRDVPRHLSVHVGGVLVTAQPLVEVVPLEHAAKPGIVVAQWNKDMVEDAGLIKIDLLSLRTLGMITEILKWIEERGDGVPDLDHLPLDDPAVYRLLNQGDALGCFQVESRAQEQMLPKMKPLCFEDIIVQVSIVRPGPIQGGMVHPYLRRRQGLEQPVYLHPLLEPVLSETLGVVIFQEQVIRVAVALAGFTPGEADTLRRAMSRARSHAAMEELRGRFVDGALANGVTREVAEETFNQLQGFATYGFCKSHAAAFALIAYQTLWLKAHYPLEFYTGLLNHQPMGFYSPDIVVGDARRHGITLLRPDANLSEDGCTIEKREAPGGVRRVLRLGLRYLYGLGEAGRERLLAARRQGRFSSLTDFCRRTRLPKPLVNDLIRAGALDGLEPERRQLLWQLGGLRYQEEALLEEPDVAVELPAVDDWEALMWDYELLGLSPDEHIMRLLRPKLMAQGVITAAQLADEAPGHLVEVAGKVAVRQAPPTAKGMLFVSLEDETGMINLIIRPDVRPKVQELVDRPLLRAKGRLQRDGGAVSVLVTEAAAINVKETRAADVTHIAS